MHHERTGAIAQQWSHLNVPRAIVRRAATLTFAPRLPVHADSRCIAQATSNCRRSDQHRRSRSGCGGGSGGGGSRSSKVAVAAAVAVAVAAAVAAAATAAAAVAVVAAAW